jgi:hypothetical protein
MNKFLFLCVLVLPGIQAYAQSQTEILQEGTQLYKSEMASWVGTDLFLAKYSDRKENAGGYFSYVSGNKAICVFFSKDATPKAIATFTFDSSYNAQTATIDGQERALTRHEQDLVTIRQTAIHEYTSDTLFHSYKNMNPNFIPVSDKQGKRVYVLTAPQEQGIVVFGNDYLLTFDTNNTLKQKRRLHNSLIPIKYDQQDGKLVLATMHTHLPETGDLITPTDVCTLLLYAPHIPWGQHFVMGPQHVSIWDCKDKDLIIMTKEAWDKIMATEKQKAGIPK